MLSEYELSAIYLSLKVAGVSIIISLPFGILFAWILSRKNFLGKNLLNGILHLPLVLPPIVIGYLLLITMGRNGFIGKFLYDTFNLSFSFNWKGAVLAVSIISFPLLVRSIRMSIDSIDKSLEDAAFTLGASRLKVFLTISLPLIMPGVIVGLVLAFARALGEFGATITFVANIKGETQTIPLAMYSFIETPGAEFQAMRLCIISIIIALVSLLISEWLSNKSQRRCK